MNEQRAHLMNFNKKPVAIGVSIAEGRMVINPTEAKNILENHNYAKQRPINKSQVKSLVNRMLQGSIRSGHSIHFAKHEGKLHLVDGQHRLTAIIESGRRQEFVVVIHPCSTIREVHSLFCTFDTGGLKRTTSDIIRAAGIAENSDISRMTARQLYEASLLVESGFVRKSPMHAPQIRNIDYRLDCVRKWTSEAVLYQNAIKQADPQLKKKLESSGAMAVGIVTFKYQRAHADQFWCRVADGQNLRKGDPRYTLNVDLRNRSFRVGSMSTAENSCCIAWNAFYHDKQQKIIRIPDGFSFALLGTPWGKK